jgi:hypothetical protein
LRILLSNVLFFYQWIAVPLLCHLSFFCDQPKYLSNQIRRLGPWETHKCFLKFFWNLQDRCVRHCSRDTIVWESLYFSTNEKVQKDKQRSTKYTHKDRVTRTPLKNGGKFMCPGRVGIKITIHFEETAIVNDIIVLWLSCSPELIIKISFSAYLPYHCSVCPFVLFRLAIVLSVLLRLTYSDYPFGIFKFFLVKTGNTRERKHNIYLLLLVDNTMVKRKSTKGQTTIYKIYT